MIPCSVALPCEFDVRCSPSWLLMYYLLQSSSVREKSLLDYKLSFDTWENVDHVITIIWWQGHVTPIENTNQTYCVYNSDVATGYGVGGFLFLLSSESLLMGVTKCMCFGRPLAPGGNRAWSIIYFVSSWWEFWYAFLTISFCSNICESLS